MIICMQSKNGKLERIVREDGHLCNETEAQEEIARLPNWSVQVTAQDEIGVQRHGKMVMGYLFAGCHDDFGRRLPIRLIAEIKELRGKEEKSLNSNVHKMLQVLATVEVGCEPTEELLGKFVNILVGKSQKGWLSKRTVLIGVGCLGLAIMGAVAIRGCATSEQNNSQIEEERR